MSGCRPIFGYLLQGLEKIIFFEWSEILFCLYSKFLDPRSVTQLK